jgi:hypothetical protein
LLLVSIAFNTTAATAATTRVAASVTTNHTLARDSRGLLAGGADACGRESA